MSVSAELDAAPSRTATPAWALEVVSACKSYKRRIGLFRAPERIPVVRDVSIRMRAGEILGLVGESGSGKSTLAKLVAGIERLDSGSVLIGDRIMSDSTTGRHEPIANRGLAMVFQDPASSLNPRMTIAQIVEEGLVIQGVDRATRAARAKECLMLVGLKGAALDASPRAFSGGQRQRIALARAIATRPRFLIADEAVSALDVSVQLQILNLLLSLRETLGLSILFITHNMSVVEYLCDRITVMSEGRIVEEGATTAVLAAPAHDYTRRLMSAIPTLSSR